MRALVGVAILVMLSVAGCSGEDPLGTGPTRSASPEALGVTTDTVQSAAAPVAKQEPQTSRVKAQSGATGRGNYGPGLGGGLGTTALSTRVRVQERAGYLQVEQALNLYKAEHDGLPKSHEEFMEKIIKPNNIILPPLAEGATYVYDPAKGELMIEKQVPK